MSPRRSHERYFLEVVIAPEITAGRGKFWPRRRTCAHWKPAACRIPASGLMTKRCQAGSCCRTAIRAVSAATILKSSRSANRRHGNCRYAVRLFGLQTREIECHRLRKRRCHGRHRCRPDEPSGFFAHRGAQIRRCCQGRRRNGSTGQRIGVASDAFFPFADGLLAAADAGATAVIQPGGSIRDEEVIAAADDAGLAMVFTGMRHFRH